MRPLRCGLCAFAALLPAAEQILWIDVPYVRQAPEACGAAALAMIARYWQRHDPNIPGAAADAREIQRRLYSQEHRGIRAADMLAYLAQNGFRAFDFQGEWKDLEEHLSLGRPLITCLAPEPGAPLHYVVVAGIGPAHVLLNDPSAGRLMRVKRPVFEQRWSGCDRWTLLAVPAGRQAAMPKGIPKAIPGDAYAAERLATLYFVEGNYDAAVKWWNKTGKPRIAEIRFLPELRMDPLARSRLLPLSGGDMLTLEDLRYTRRMLDGLGFLRRREIELVAQPEERYELHIHTAERPSFPRPASMLGGAMFLTFHFNLYNLRGAGVNWTTMVRADARKRRLLSTFDGPAGGASRWRYALFADIRREVWNTGAEDFRLNRTEAGLGFRLLANSRAEWGSGFSVSGRNFRGASGMAGGTALEYRSRLAWRLLDVPERGFTADVNTGRSRACSQANGISTPSFAGRWGRNGGRGRAGPCTLSAAG